MNIHPKGNWQFKIENVKPRIHTNKDLFFKVKFQQIDFDFRLFCSKKDLEKITLERFFVWILLFVDSLRFIVVALHKNPFSLISQCE